MLLSVHTSVIPPTNSVATIHIEDLETGAKSSIDVIHKQIVRPNGKEFIFWIEGTNCSIYRTKTCRDPDGNQYPCRDTSNCVCTGTPARIEI